MSTNSAIVREQRLDLHDGEFNVCMDHLRGGLEEESNSNVAAAVYRAWESMTFKLPAAATSYFITFCGSSPRYNTVDGK